MVYTEEMFEEMQAIERAEETKKLAQDAVKNYHNRVAAFTRKLALKARYGPPQPPCGVSVNEPLPGVEIKYVSRVDKSYYKVES